MIRMKKSRIRSDVSDKRLIFSDDGFTSIENVICFCPTSVAMQFLIESGNTDINS